MMAEFDILELIRQQKAKEILERNMAYANPQWQQQLAQLTPEQETAFLAWVKSNKVPFDPSDPTPDYDMRGFYQGVMSGDPKAQSGFNPATQSLHYPDYYKTPYHESFSAESQYATEGAPTWQDDKLVSPSGKVIFQDKPE
jgi:hypothetical protein